MHILFFNGLYNFIGYTNITILQQKKEGLGRPHLVQALKTLIEGLF